MNPFSDNTQFIMALKNGDAKAYSYLVDTYHHKLCVYAYGLTHDHDTAKDVVQNVFVRIWKKRHQLNTDFSITGFLYKSVYNEFIDQYRKQKSFFPLEKKYIDKLTTFIEEEDSNSLEKLIEIVKHEIQNLPPKCKETFLLSKEDGLTNIEIAEHKNISLKTVEAHMTKAFTILRSKIGGKMDGILFLLFGMPKSALFHK